MYIQVQGEEHQQKVIKKRYIWNIIICAHIHDYVYIPTNMD